MNVKPTGPSSAQSNTPQGSAAQSSSTLDRYLKPAGGSTAAPVPPAAAPGAMTTDPEPLARMIDFVAKSGKRTALPYAYLVSATLEGNELCEMTFTEHTVTLKGRNMGLLYQHLLAGTLRVVGESGSGFDAGKSDCWVESITIQSRANR